MTLWDRLKSSILAKLTREPQPYAGSIWGGLRTTGGEYVDAETSIKVSAVWACLSYLSRSVAQLPWRVMLETQVGSDEARTHPVSRLLRQRPNSEIGPFAFKETMVWWAALHGNAVAEIQFDGRGVPVGLWPIHPNRVTFDRNRETGELVYRIWNEGIAVAELRADQVFHLRGFGYGPIGIDVVSYAAESIGWARATELFGSAYFGEGMSPSGIFKTKGTLKADGLTALKNEVKSVFQGSKKAHRTLFLDSDMEYQRLAIDPASSQLLEIRQHQVEEICRWFGVPPHKVMHLLRATFSNIEHQSIEVVVDSITPWCKRLEEEADYKLFGLNRQGYYTKLDVKGLLRGDFKTRTEGYKVLREMGVLNVNEIRLLEDMNPIGPDGDKRIVPMNMTTLERLGEEPQPAASSQQQDTPPQQDPEGENPVDRARRQMAIAKTVH